MRLTASGAILNLEVADAHRRCPTACSRQKASQHVSRRTLEMTPDCLWKQGRLIRPPSSAPELGGRQRPHMPDRPVEGDGSALQVVVQRLRTMGVEIVGLVHLKHPPGAVDMLDDRIQ